MKISSSYQVCLIRRIIDLTRCIQISYFKTENEVDLQGQKSEKHRVTELNRKLSSSTLPWFHPVCDGCLSLLCKLASSHK